MGTEKMSSITSPNLRKASKALPLLAQQVKDFAPSLKELQELATKWESGGYNEEHHRHTLDALSKLLQVAEATPDASKTSPKIQCALAAFDSAVVVDLRRIAALDAAQLACHELNSVHSPGHNLLPQKELNETMCLARQLKTIVLNLAATITTEDQELKSNELRQTRLKIKNDTIRKQTYLIIINFLQAANERPSLEVCEPPPAKKRRYGN